LAPRVRDSDRQKSIDKNWRASRFGHGGVALTGTAASRVNVSLSLGDYFSGEAYFVLREGPQMSRWKFAFFEEAPQDRR
jgi:hypothetical protein